MNVFLLLLLLVGFVFVTIGYVKSGKRCPPRRVEYRHIPRTMVEEQMDPTPVTDIFASMFFESTPFLSHSTRPLPPPTQQSDINKFFVSQN